MIPGDPAAVEAAAARLEGSRDHYEQSGQSLAHASEQITDWHGAAGDTARSVLADQSRCLPAAVRAVSGAAPVLREYAAALRAAQMHFATGEQLVAAGQVVAGEQMMQAAVLEAQTANQAAAGQIAALMGDVAAVAPPGSVPASRGGGRGTHPDGTQGSVTVTGPTVGTSASGPGDGKLGQLSAYANLAQVSATGSTQLGDARLSGSADATVGANANASAGIDGSGLHADAEATAGVQATASGSVDYGPASAHVGATGMAGVTGSAGLGVGKDGLKANASAFAGAKASVSGGADVGGIGAGGTAEGWAGAGVEADATFGKGADGKFHIGGSVGAALGVGGKLGGEITIDPEKIADTYHDAADAVGDTVDDAKDTIEDGFDGAKDAVGGAIDDIF